MFARAIGGIQTETPALEDETVHFGETGAPCLEPNGTIEVSNQ